MTVNVEGLPPFVIEGEGWHLLGSQKSTCFLPLQ